MNSIEEKHVCGKMYLIKLIYLKHLDCVYVCVNELDKLFSI